MKLYDKVMEKLRIADVEGSVIRTAISTTLSEIEKDMSLINQGYENKPEFFFTIPQGKWTQLKEDIRK